MKKLNLSKSTTIFVAVFATVSSSYSAFAGANHDHDGPWFANRWSGQIAKNDTVKPSQPSLSPASSSTISDPERKSSQKDNAQDQSVSAKKEGREVGSVSLDSSSLESQKIGNPSDAQIKTEPGPKSNDESDSPRRPYHHQGRLGL